MSDVWILENSRQKVRANTSVAVVAASRLPAVGASMDCQPPAEKASATFTMAAVRSPGSLLVRSITLP